MQGDLPTLEGRPRALEVKPGDLPTIEERPLPLGVKVLEIEGRPRGRLAIEAELGGVLLEDVWKIKIFVITAKEKREFVNNYRKEKVE